MNFKKIALLAVVAMGATVLALAQLPGGYSNAPTDKDYRMRIAEPKEGATITGKDVTIVLTLPAVPTGQGVNEKERQDTLTPTFQFFVDGKSVGNLPNGQNAFTAHDLSYGPHKITVLAKNTAGEVVDRKEIGITTVEAVATQTTTEKIQPAPVAAAPAPAPPEPAAPPAPEPAAPAPSTPATLPATGSSAPAAAAAGLGLLVVGLALRRRA